MNKSSIVLSAALSAWAVAAAAGQVAFTSGNIVVLQVGDGAAALNNASTAGSLVEFAPTGGSPVQTIAIPTTGSGSNRALTFSGSATSEGFLTRSVNGEYLVFAGYDSATGVTGIATTTAAAVNRVIGRIDANAVLDTSTAMEAYNAGNIRGAASTNGIDFWTSGTSATTGGVRYIQYGTTTSFMVSPTPTNVRVSNIFNDQLYISTASGAFIGVNAVGTGLPTNEGNTTVQLPGFPTATGPSPYDFFFSDANTIYVADDRTAASGGGIQKWTFDSTAGTWSLAYTLNVGAGARGLTGVVESGTVTLYATTAVSNANHLVSIVDTGAGATFNQLAQAAVNTAFRGVDFAPGSGTTPVDCYANCDNSTNVPFLNVLDFNCFLNKFNSNDPTANCDNSTNAPVLNVLDFNCFLNKFNAGCTAP